MIPRRATATAALAGVFILSFIASCGEPPKPRRPEFESSSFEPSSITLPSLDVKGPGHQGPDSLFAGLRDRASPGPRGDDHGPRPTPRQFQVGVEPDNTRDQATEIELSGEVWGWIHPPLSETAPDVDWYSVNVDLDTTRAISVELAPVEGCDLALELWHKGVTGAARLMYRVDAYGASQAEHLANVALTNGRWFLKVSAGEVGGVFPWNVRDPYRLKIAVDAVDGGHELEPDNDERRANHVLPGSPMDASLSLGDEDWFRIDASRIGLESRVALDILPDQALSLTWEVITQDRVTVLSGEATAGQRVHVPNLGISPGLETFYVVIRAPEDLEGMARYTISATVHALESRTQLEPDNTNEIATRIEVPVTISGWLHDPKDRDVFFISPGDAKAVAIDLDGIPGVRPYFELMDALGESMGRLEAQEVGAGISLPNWAPVDPRGGWIALGSMEGAAPLTPYALALQVRDISGEEIEPNDDPGEASMINPDMDGLQGFITYTGDRDTYLLPIGMVPLDGTLELTVEERGDRSIRATVYGADTRIIDQLTVPRSGRDSLSLSQTNEGPMFLQIESADQTLSLGRHGYRVTAMPTSPEPLEDGR